MKVMADDMVCEGIGMCESMAPDVFEVGDNGTVDVLDETPDDDRADEIKAAVESCPVSALRLAQ